MMISGSFDKPAQKCQLCKEKKALVIKDKKLYCAYCYIKEKKYESKKSHS